MDEAPLGNRMKCRVTGLTGIVVAKTTYLFGLPRLCLQPAIGDDGRMQEPTWFEAAQLETVVE